jgi:uncharacterized protein YjbI with pentapeptide repeats
MTPQFDEKYKAARALRRTLLVGLVIVLGYTVSMAQDRPTRGAGKTPMTGKALLEALSGASAGAPVTGALIDGDEILSIILAGKHSIHIDNSTIDGGLVWQTAATVPIEVAITNTEILPSAVSRRVGAGSAVSARGVRFLAPINFSGSTMHGIADFGQARFRMDAGFRNVKVLHGAQFEFAEFGRNAGFQGFHGDGTVSFSNVRFDGRTAFSNAVFAMADFSQARFAESANFGGATFNEAADFAGTRFEKRVRFDRAVFVEPQIFESHFLGRATFVAVEFRDNVMFRSDGSRDREQFRAGATFFDTRIDGRAEFNHLSIPSDLTILQTTIAHCLSLAFTTLDGQFSLTASSILGPSNFDGSIFNNGANFSDTVFDAETTIRDAHFAKSVVLKKACFNGTLSLQNSDLGPYADFRTVTISHLDLRSSRKPTILRSRLDMRGATIALAEFHDVIFENSVDLSDAAFGSLSVKCGDKSGEVPARPGLILRFVTFEGPVLAQRTDLSGHIVIFGTKFEQGVDFTNTRFPDLDEAENASFSLGFFDLGDVRLRWHQLPDPRGWSPVADTAQTVPGPTRGLVDTSEPVSRTLATLEGIFRDRQQLADANAAAYHRERAELQEARENGWKSERLEKEIEWLVWGVTCGYGTKIWWIVGWASLLNLVFTLVYWRWAEIQRKPHPQAEQEFRFRLRLLDLPKQYSTTPNVLPVASVQWRKLIDALRVSSVILLKVGYRDTTLSGSIGPIAIKAVVAVEWVLGFLVLAAFMVTLSNTQPLLNRLISGVL